jgi:signal transduction histidine kinase
MALFKSRFSRKLHMAFGAMLAVTLALAWYFYDSVQWFEYDVERMAIANSVLNDYRSVFVEGNQKLGLIEESIDKGEIRNLPRWHGIDSNLRTTIGRIRQSLAEEAALQSTGRIIDENAVLDELEGMLESIFDRGEAIRASLETQQAGNPRAEAERLSNVSATEIFNELMNEILADREKVVSDANAEAVSLANYITGVLPLFMIALVGFTTLIAWLFSRSLTRSVNVLHDGAQTFTGGDLNHRIPELQEEEFGRLGEAFNLMAQELAGHRVSMHDSNVRLEAIVEERTRALKSSNERLATVDESRRKLLADISHEFRTPLTVIRGEAEIALRGKVKTSKEYKETLKRIMEQSDQTAKAEQLQIDIRHKLPEEEHRVMGDDGRLRQVFSILIDNALRYSNPGGVVNVGMEKQHEEIVVTVDDSGIGLTEEEARLAFQRFFRGGQAQSHARGTGLGLPVAKAIVEAHSGSIRLEGKPDEGTMATVVLPLVEIQEEAG